MIPFKIENLRTGNFKGASKAFFDIAFGYTMKKVFQPLFVVKDFMLTTAKNGEFFILGPFKYRTDAEGEKLKNQAGYFIRDEFWKPIWEGERGAGTINSDSAAYREELIAAAVDEYRAVGETPAKEKPVRKTPERETVSATTGSSRTRAPKDLDEEDDDLPF